MRNISSTFVLASFVCLAAASGAAFSTAGCGGGGSGTGGGGSGGAPACFDYTNFDTKSPTVSFKTDVLPIFQLSCGLSGQCHGDPSMPFTDRPYLGPNMMTTATADDIAKIRAGTIGVASALEPNMAVILAGDPSKSFIMYKLDDELVCDKLDCAATTACGTIMPQGNDKPMEQAKRDTIRRWIAQGALDN